MWAITRLGSGTNLAWLTLASLKREAHYHDAANALEPRLGEIQERERRLIRGC